MIDISGLNSNIITNGIGLYVSFTRYLLFFLMAAYTYLNFRYFRTDPAGKRRVCASQLRILFVLHLIAYSVIAVRTMDRRALFLYGLEAAFFLCYIFVSRILYPNGSRILTNNICMFLCVGFIILTRLDFDRALRQFILAAISATAAWIVPFIVKKVRFLDRLEILYGAVGAGLLTAVLVTGNTSFGAQLSLSFGGISVQPSEFVKIIYVFFIAAMLSRSGTVKNLAVTTAAAALHVLVLVLSRDLGGALIFFVTYLFMLYAATSSKRLLAAGVISGSAAAAAAYALFSHVRDRVLAWRDPWSDIDNKGYQVTQSLFAIGTGGWFGLGLYEGMPGRIPVVEKDFIFAAVSEEMGALFSICLLLICLGCYLQTVLIAGRIEELFYKLVAFGLGTVYIVQVFLTVGGVTKFIPSTGVTLPLVSYGGSSLLSTFLLFGVIQGLYLRAPEAEEAAGKEAEYEDI